MLPLLVVKKSHASVSVFGKMSINQIVNMSGDFYLRIVHLCPSITRYLARKENIADIVNNYC